jgi:hypothetical protein
MVMPDMANGCPGPQVRVLPSDAHLGRGRFGWPLDPHAPPHSRALTGVTEFQFGKP